MFTQPWRDFCLRPNTVEVNGILFVLLTALTKCIKNNNNSVLVTLDNPDFVVNSFHWNYFLLK